MSNSIKLKSLLKEGFAWERKPGKPLPTIQEVMDEYEAKQEKEAPIKEISREAIDRIEGLVNQNDIKEFNSSILRIKESLESDGFESKDIYDYLNGYLKYSIFKG